MGGIEVVEDLETKRIQARRARDQERAKKLYNARLRNIGADIAGIQIQVQQKLEAKKREKEEEDRYVRQQQEIQRYVTQVEAEEDARKRQEAERMRREWNQQSRTRSERVEADIQVGILDTPSINGEVCGISAAQKFDGEDRLKAERERLQAAQFRQWSRAQTEEKRQKEAAERMEQQQYSDYMRDVVNYQNEVEQEFSTSKARENVQLLNTNQRMAQERSVHLNMQRQREEEESQREVNGLINSAYLTESRDQSVSVIPGRVRTDHWKGMKTDEVKSIIFANEDVKREKAAIAEREMDKEREYAEQQAHIRRCLEEQEYQEYQRQQNQHIQLQRTLDKQKEENKAREQAQKENSRGKIERGFFENFGKSYR